MVIFTKRKEKQGLNQMTACPKYLLNNNTMQYNFLILAENHGGVIKVAPNICFGYGKHLFRTQFFGFPGLPSRFLRKGWVP